MKWSSLKGKGPRRFTVRKTDLLYKDMAFWLSPSGLHFLGNLFNSSSTHFLVVLFFWAVHGTEVCSIVFFLELLLGSLSTQLFFLVGLLLLLLSMTAFSYVGFLSLFWVRFFHALYLSYFPPSSFHEGLSSEQFAELRSVHLLAFSTRAYPLAFLSSVSPS